MLWAGPFSGCARGRLRGSRLRAGVGLAGSGRPGIVEQLWGGG